MRSADEVPLVDTVYGAYLCASTASGAKIVVDYRQIILDGDSTLRAGLLTLHTAYAAVGAILTGESTLILVGALHDYAGGVVDKVYNAVGALAYADTAADTLSGVNACHAVLYADGVLGADDCAVAVTEAGEGAELVTAIRHIDGETGLVTLVVVLSGGGVTRAVAGNVRNLFHNICRLDTEDSRDTLGTSVTAGNAEVGLVGCLVCKSLSVAVAARVSARTAVCTGQAVTDSERSFVLLDGEEDACHGEYRRTDKTDAEKKQCRN